MRHSGDIARTTSSSSQVGKTLAFFLRFLKEPKQVGSLVPSSSFLERRLVAISAVSEARTVVELGPGMGGTTQALLNAMPCDGKLLAIEIDPRFTEMLRREIRDPRLIAHHGHAEGIAATLAAHGLPAPEVIVSGIPFSTMPRHVGKSVLRAVWVALAPGGRFVAYQLRDRVAVLGREIFGKAEADLELLNVPPIRVYCWHKPG